MSEMKEKLEILNIVEVFLEWTKRKIYYDLIRQPSFYFYEAEIWWTAMGKNIGHEINGKHGTFRRPAIIFKKYSKETCLVIPLTTKIKENWLYHIPFEYNGLRMAAVICQAKTISSRRLLHKMGKLDPTTFNLVKEKFIDSLK